MGQLVCTKQEEGFDFERYTLQLSRAKTQTMDRTLSFCTKYNLGKKMQIGTNEKISVMWNEKLEELEKCDQINSFRTTSSYSNSLQSPISDKLFSKYPLITNQQEYYMLTFFFVQPNDFKQYGLQGIPQELRWAYWKVLVLHDQIQKQQVMQFESGSSYHITKDVTRTLIADAFKDEVGIEKLEKVLNSIASKYPQVGYCQGMNYIAALLLMVSGANELETCNMLCVLFNSPFYLLNLLFKNDLPLLFILEEIILVFIKKRFPKLFNHFIQTDTPNSFWLSKILLSGFVYLFEVRESVLLWDYILIRGTIKGFTELILAMMTVYHDKLIAMDAGEIAQFFSFNEKKSADAIISQALKNNQIQGSEIRKIMKKNKSELGKMFQFFEQKEFDYENQKIILKEQEELINDIINSLFEAKEQIQPHVEESIYGFQRITSIKQFLPNLCGFYALFNAYFQSLNVVLFWKFYFQLIHNLNSIFQGDFDCFQELQRYHLDYILKNSIITNLDIYKQIQQEQQIEEVIQFYYGYNFIQNSEEEIMQIQNKFDQLRNQQISQLTLICGITIHFLVINFKWNNNNKLQIEVQDSQMKSISKLFEQQLSIDKQQNIEKRRKQAYKIDLRNTLILIQEILNGKSIIDCYLDNAMIAIRESFEEYIDKINIWVQDEYPLPVLKHMIFNIARNHNRKCTKLQFLMNYDYQSLKEIQNELQQLL